MSNTILSPDVQTGRNVYANEDLYNNDPDYKDKIDKYVAEGFMLVFGTPDNPTVPTGGSSGGGSDFTTAEVTMTNPTMDELYFVGIIVDDDGMYSDGGFIDTSPTNTIVLYKGTQTLHFEDTPSLTVTGSLEYDEIEGMLTVTGNGTITIS